MKHLLSNFSLLGVLLCIPVVATAETRVFLLGGQSNMVGVGNSAELAPPYNAPQTDVNFWNGSVWVPLSPGFGNNSGSFGPEVGFGRAIKDAMPGDDIYLVKYAVSGTALYNDWAPTSGPQYVGFMNRANAALASLDAAGIDYDISAMLWMQGESDALEGQAAGYDSNLRNFIADMRTQFSTPDMPFIMGRVLDYYGGASGQADIVRATQVNVAETTGNVEWIDTDGYTLANAGHYDAQGLIDMGNDFAGSYVQLVPEPSSLSLLAMAALGILGVGWRRRKRFLGWGRKGGRKKKGGRTICLRNK